MVNIHRMLLFIEAEEEERSENGDVEACETLTGMKKELEIREVKKPAEIEDGFGNVYAGCPNCGEHIINYLNKKSFAAVLHDVRTGDRLEERQ